MPSSADTRRGAAPAAVMARDPATAFYTRQYGADRYAPETDPERHPFFPILRGFIDAHGLRTARCLEVGCGRGAFQHLVPDYTGVDIADAVGRHLNKPFCRASATDLPFADDSFDALWSYAALEHIPRPERALREMRRVLRDGGLLLLAPAWQCRPWAAEGYPVRPYRDLDWKGRLVKASIRVREAVWFRAARLLPVRLARTLRLLAPGPTAFRYRTLRPNYDHFWMADSDAVNSMDPHEAILWFVSRGDRCLTHPGRARQLLVRTGALAFAVRKAG